MTPEEFDAETIEANKEKACGRLEIHVTRFLSVNANVSEHGSGVSYFKAAIDDRTMRMLKHSVPKRYYGAVLPSMRNIAFHVEAARPGSKYEYVLTVGSEAVNGFTKYTDGHAMFLITVSRQEYRELQSWLRVDRLASGYDVDFDFEPLDNPRNYGCIGSRIAHLVEGH